MHTGLQDLRYAARKLRHHPGFSLTAILTLALGIGAATAVFSVTYGVLIDPFPYKNVQTLVTPRLCSPQWSRCSWRVYTPEQFLAIQQKTDLFDGVAASAISSVVITGGSEPQSLHGDYITASTFEVFGVEPILGRASTQLDVSSGHGEVALLSYRFWAAHFGKTPEILGRVLTFNGHPRTIIGVLPPRFLWRGADVYLPVSMTAAPEVQGQRYFTLVGRLRPGVTDAQAGAELKPVFDDFAQSAPRTFPKDLRIGIMPLNEMRRSELANSLHLLLGSVFVLLLIACVNVSSLLLARAVQREQEFIIRASIGASRWSLIRSSLIESVLLATATIPVALIFAWLGLQATQRIVPTEAIPDEAVITLNVPVLLVSIAIALLTVLIFGLAPAWRSANPQLGTSLGRGAHSSSGRTERRLLGSFVVFEIALSLTLLTLANLMVRSLIAAENTPVAFSPDRTLALQLPFRQDRYPTPQSRSAFFLQLLERIRHIPGVKSATTDSSFPLMGALGVNIQIARQPADNRPTNLHLVDPQYLAVSRLKLLQGHFVDERETGERAYDAVVTQRFVQRYFKNENVLGQVVHLRLLGGEGQKPLLEGDFTVVGVIEDAPVMTDVSFQGYSPADIFLPNTVAPLADILLVSTEFPADALMNPVRRAVYSVDKDQPIAEMLTVRQLLDSHGYAEPRFSLALFGAFAAAALLLSLVGTYGILSFITSQRTHEIGIRMALGAGRLRVMGIVLRQACLLAIIGVLVGLPLALFAGLLAKDELIGTSQHDPFSIFIAFCVLPLLAVAGTLLPARRAASIDPARALRAE